MKAEAHHEGNGRDTPISSRCTMALGVCGIDDVVQPVEYVYFAVPRVKIDEKQVGGRIVLLDCAFYSLGYYVVRYAAKRLNADNVGDA